MKLLAVKESVRFKFTVAKVMLAVVVKVAVDLTVVNTVAVLILESAIIVK